MSDIAMILQRIGATLSNEVAPKLEGDYSGGHASMSGILAGMAGEMWDKEADLLVEEINRLRGLLAAGKVDDTVEKVSSYRISDLKRTRNELAEKLIELQTRLEGQDDADSAHLNTQIWAHLLTTSMARMPSPPQFSEG
ncbi:hypothetical protein [Henriciella litoralis]|uniref:hypothetical protein n=1 Tax=Henriciella litoralis TaxID=568102 RepID=UPI000A054F76|nr:hypothetical protein [Henriciella litoralis]